MSRRPVVILCGGTGTAGFALDLAKAFAPVSFVTNAYDDGLSTGRVRRHLGVLGPSDPGKLAATLSRETHPAAAALLASRLPVEPRGDLAESLSRELAASALPARVAARFSRWIGAFLAAVEDAERTQGPFDPTDLAVRNAVLVGAAIEGGGFQEGVDLVTELLDLPAEILVVATDPGFLVAELIDGTVIADEATLSTGPLPSPVRALAILPPGYSLGDAERIADAPRPAAASRVVDRLCDSRAIVYAPGTLFSSIVPTVLIVGEAIASAGGPKVLVANLAPEPDGASVADAVDAITAMAGATTAAARDSYVTHVLVDESIVRGADGALSLGAVPDGVELVVARMAAPSEPRWHEPEPLVDALAGIIGSGAAG